MMKTHKLSVFVMIIISFFWGICVQNNRRENTETTFDCSKCTQSLSVDVKAWRNEYMNLESLEILANTSKEDGEYYFDFVRNPNLTISHPEIIFSANTFAAEVAKLFPESAKLNKPAGNAWKGIIEVFVSPNEGDYRVWRFIFKNETLKLMYLYDPFDELK